MKIKKTIKQVLLKYFKSLHNQVIKENCLFEKDKLVRSIKSIGPNSHFWGNNHFVSGGEFLTIGENVHINSNCFIKAEGGVEIGDNT
ncbi:MAG: hypothetical protein ACK4FS_07830, partial [Flavobacterium sp.]